MAFPVALASYSFHGLQGEGKWNVFNYLQALKYHYHVENTDIWTGFFPTLEPDFIAAVRACMDGYGQSMANLCVDGPHIWMDDPEARAAHKAQMLQYIEAAKRLGAKTIRIDFGGETGKPMSEEAFAYIVETYREYCALCGAEGIKIGPENHWGWDKTSDNLIAVRDAVASPWYGHLFHLTGFLPGDEEAGLAYALSCAMHTHIPANSMPVAKELIRLLAASGYQGAYSVEHHSGKFEQIRVEWQLGCLRNDIAELQEEGLEAPAKPDYITANYLK